MSAAMHDLYANPFAYLALSSFIDLNDFAHSLMSADEHLILVNLARPILAFAAAYRAGQNFYQHFAMAWFRTGYFRHRRAALA